MANAVWTSVTLGILGAFAAIGFLRGTDFFPAANPAMLWFTVALAPAMLAFLYGTNLLIGTGRIRAFNLFETFGNLLVVGALVVVGVAGGGVRAYLATSASAWGLISTVLLVYLVRASKTRLTFSTAVFRSGLRYATKALSDLTPGLPHLAWKRLLAAAVLRRSRARVLLRRGPGGRCARDLPRNGRSRAVPQPRAQRPGPVAVDRARRVDRGRHPRRDVRRRSHRRTVVHAGRVRSGLRPRRPGASPDAPGSLRPRHDDRSLRPTSAQSGCRESPSASG